MPSRTGILVQPRDLPDNFKAVSNPAVHVEDNKIHLFCRLVDPYNNSEIRRVVLDFDYQITHIDPLPALSDQNKFEKHGCEDPRMVEIDRIHYLTYTAVFDGRREWRTWISLASSETLDEFQRLCFVLAHLGNNKNGVLLGEKINNLFWLYHRIKPNIHIASSPNLKSWHHQQKAVMTVRSFSWDEHHIGMGAPPLKTDLGWLAFYHGADCNNSYRIGAALFDLEKPYKLLARSKDPLLEPEEDYEKRGIVNNVAFTCGALEHNDTYVVFYGGGDRVTAAVEFSKKEIQMNLQPVYHSG